MRLCPLLPSLRIVLELLLIGEQLLIDLPPATPQSPFDSDPFEWSPIDYFPLLCKRLVAYQHDLLVRLAEDKSDEHIAEVADSVSTLLRMLSARKPDRRRGYDVAYQEFNLRIERLRQAIDEELVSHNVKDELVSLLRDLSSAANDESDPSDSVFEEKLKAAARFIHQSGTLMKGLKGSVVAKHIGVSSGTLRRHYIPPLKARFGVENEGNGYYINPSFALTRGLSKEEPIDFQSRDDIPGYFANDGGSF